MKTYVIEITAFYTVEITEDQMRNEFGKANVSLAKKMAINDSREPIMLEKTAKLFDTYEDQPQRSVRKGVGSY